MADVKGICPIIAAPFDNNGEVDHEDLYNLVGTLSKGGCGHVTLFGIAGEYYKLNDEERKEMVKTTVKSCNDHGGHALISVTDHSTENAVKQAKAFQEAVANAVDIPIMVQYAPEQTGVAIAPEVFQKLGNECKNVEYYKIECKPAGPYVTNLMKLSEGQMKIFVGNAGFQLIECMDRGAIGAMPGCSMYDVYIDIFNTYLSGDRKGAIEKHNKILPMLNHIRQNVEQIISFEKRILKKRGIIKTDYCRKPSYNSDPYFDRLFEEFYEEMAKQYGWN